ncbi:peptidase domain-containing ABC transporter [Leptolyngbya sp. AN03gr2]|uniref:peptidase domain-containing ABC transporter n=1 Tax=unclassified Leptolyngbya TaxID=2650499 RepID=UPI003D319225
MINIASEVRSFLPSLFQSYPFNRLSAAACRQVASNVQLLAFRPGEVIQSEQELPNAVYCVVQGSIRVVGSMVDQCPTIARIGVGETVGWEALLRRRSVGSIRAAGFDQEVLALAIAADIFEQIATTDLYSQSSPVSAIELYDILTHFLNLVPTQLEISDVPTLVREVVDQRAAIIQQYGSASSVSEPLSSDYLWLVSSGFPSSAAVGSVIATADQIPQAQFFPVRVVGIERTFLAVRLMRESLPQLPASQASAPIQSSDGILAQMERLLNMGTSSQVSDPALLPPAKSYPAHLARSPDLGEALAIAFWNVCDFLNIPYRPDHLRKWYARLEALPDDRLDWYRRIADAFELKAYRVRFSATAGGLMRLQTPAFIFVEHLPWVLYEVNENRAIAASPHSGLVELPPENLIKQLSIDENSPTGSLSTALVFQRKPHSPTQQFGWRWLLPYFNQHKSILIQIFVASLFVQLLGLANPLITQQIIDKAIINGSANALPLFAVLLLVFTALETILTILRSYLFSSTTNRVDLELGTEIVRHLLNLSLPFFTKRPVGELAARVSELETIRKFLTGTALTVVLDVVFSLLYVGVMLLYSIPLTLCVLASVPIVIGLTLLASPVLDKLIRRRSDHHARMQSYLIETLSGMFTVKVQRMEPLMQSTWRNHYLQYLGSSFRTHLASTIFQSTGTFINHFSSLLVLWIGGGLVLKGELSLGSLIAFRIIAGYVTGPMVRLANLGQTIQEANLSMELLADVKNTATEFSPHEAQKLTLPSIVGRVQYVNTGFGFQLEQRQLIDINLDVAPGSFVGIVGQSGSGKSTLVKLLPRLYEPQQGSIYIDGIDISKVNLASLRDQLGYVPQDTTLFDGTIRENITAFRDVDDATVMQAAVLAEIHDFIMTLPDGYSTSIGERGASLSGGQRQRLAIARMILTDPRLLILDEATSALDYETERRVVENLMKTFNDRTVFFITHRLANVKKADWVVYLHNGAIVEQGTHAELMARQQRYYCLYTQQAHLTL